MDAVLFLLTVLGLWPALVAREKGRSFLLWWVVGTAVLPVAVVATRRMAPRPERTTWLDVPDPGADGAGVPDGASTDGGAAGPAPAEIVRAAFRLGADRGVDRDAGVAGLRELAGGDRGSLVAAYRLALEVVNDGFRSPRGSPRGIVLLRHAAREPEPLTATGRRRFWIRPA